MGWRRSRPRTLWQTIVDALVFLSVLFIVLALLNRFDLINVPDVQVATGSLSVIDGDSLRKGETEIRLVGIDAPEYRQTCADQTGKNYPCGKEATSALRNLVSGGEVVCESHQVDRYHRALSTCRIGKSDINREMVRQGWAIAYGFHGSEFDYVLDENEARRLKRGLWQGSFEKPSDYRKRQRAMQSNATGLSEPDD